MSASAEAAENEPNLTPLLDVVLQLIMFFMITVNFVRTEHLPPDIILPVAQAAVPMDNTVEDWVYLNLNAKGRLVGSSELEELDTPQKVKRHLGDEKDRMEREAREKGRKGEIKMMVVLRAHEDARYHQIWEVLDSCTKAGFKRWQIRVMTNG